MDQTDLTLDGVSKLISNLDIPNKITSNKEIDNLAGNAKILKLAQATLKAKKKELELPFETARKEAQVELNKAKEEKKLIGDPYTTLIKQCCDTEQNIRSLITNFKNEELRKKQEEEARVRRLYEEKERKKEEAIRAKEHAREEGDKEAQIEALHKEKELEKVSNELAKLEIEKQSIPIDVSLNTRSMKTLDFKVTDINSVPDDYISYVIDMDKITKAILTTFPFISELTYTAAYDTTPDEYMKDTVIKNKVMSDLKQNVNIPGIERTVKEHLVIA